MSQVRPLALGSAAAVGTVAGAEKKSAKSATAQVAHGLKRAEAGDTGGAAEIRQAEKIDPADTEATEQSAADGPKGRGVAR
jgi:hypothetical protein